eukprot:gene4760-9466_t
MYGILSVYVIFVVSCYSGDAFNRYQHIGDIRERSTSLYSIDLVSLSSFQLTTQLDIQKILSVAGSKAFDGGVAGASASAVQVISLMWLRTAMNYQYKYGNTTMNVIKSLYNEGGISRLYQGLPFALVQGPMSRFGDTAANTMVLALLEILDQDGKIPLTIRTALGSFGAGGWRVFLMPIDAAKTTLQVNGREGLDALQKRVSTDGIKTLYAGSIAAAAATVVGHYPWFYTYNYLSSTLPLPADIITLLVGLDPQSASLSSLDPRLVDLARSAFIGLCASSISDVCSNSLRVLKTYMQTAEEGESYTDVTRKIIETDGIRGLLGRGLQDQILNLHEVTDLVAVVVKNYSTTCETYFPALLKQLFGNGPSFHRKSNKKIRHMV